MMTKHLLRFQLKTFNQSKLSKLRHKFIRLSHHKKSYRNLKEISRGNSVIFSESAQVQTPLLINYFSREGIIFLPTLLAASVIASETKCEALEENEDQNEEAYDEEAETCPFCRYFLDSPCREQFKAWHACVQRSEKATDCMEPFHPLKKCMDDHGIVMGTEDDEESDPAHTDEDEAK